MPSATVHVQVLGPETSGQVEYALLVAPGGDVCVTVASDHSDRSFEHYGIQRSKQLYPDVLAAEVWPHSEVESHVDDVYSERPSRSSSKTRYWAEVFASATRSRYLDRLRNE